MGLLNLSGTPTFSFGGVPDSCFQNPSEIPGYMYAIVGNKSI